MEKSKLFLFICIFFNVLVQWYNASTSSDVTGEVPMTFERLDSENTTGNSSDTSTISITSSTQIDIDNPSEYCPDNAICSDLSQDCLECVYNASCVYGMKENMTCTVKDGVHCQGNQTLTRELTCGYCYQLNPALYTCSTNNTCSVVTSPPRSTYIATCLVKPSVDCMGNRKFLKKLPCNWTSGYSWSTALALSITLGGLGADRFYLGLWRAGLGKLFSFGGLGVWTLVDVILIAIGYIGPSDGSLYM